MEIERLHSDSAAPDAARATIETMQMHYDNLYRRFDDLKAENAALKEQDWVIKADERIRDLEFQLRKETARQAGFEVNPDPDQPGFFYLKNPDGECSDISYPSESEAWWEAANRLGPANATAQALDLSPRQPCPGM